MIITMKNCNHLQVHRYIECMRELEAAKDQGYLGCRPPIDEAAFSVKGTVYYSWSYYSLFLVVGMLHVLWLKTLP